MKIILLFLLLPGVLLAGDMQFQHNGPVETGEQQANYLRYVQLVGPAEVWADPSWHLVSALCTGGNVIVHLPQINTNIAQLQTPLGNTNYNWSTTWVMSFQKSTKDVHALILVPYTNGPTVYSPFGTNDITYRDFNGIPHTATNNITETNFLASYKIGFGPDGQHLGPVP